jgi:hypothetical protein
VDECEPLPLGFVTLRAREREQDDQHAVPHTKSTAPEEIGVQFERRGVAVDGKVWLSAAAYTSPRDEHFGDGPYVSRSAGAHTRPLLS